MRAEVDSSGALPTRIAVWAVRSYQLILSPQLGMACRFEPSCSNYAIHALRRHGLARGTWIALKRLLRCHPLGEAGYDPVP